jgi:hypothetical protein
MNKKHEEAYSELEKFNGKIVRRIEKEIEYFPVWSAWMKDIKGIGPFLAGNLILLYYYKFIPVCKSCGGDLVKAEIKDQPEKKAKKAKKVIIDDSDNGERKQFVCAACHKVSSGDGVLKHRIDVRDFPNVSAWWHYMGEHIVDGKKPKMSKGVKCTWSPKGRKISFMIGDQVNRRDENHDYKKFMIETKTKLHSYYPDRSDMHIHKMARMQTSKLFLSHLWHVAREIEGKSTRGIYADVILGHTGIIPPYYWGGWDSLF